MKGVILRPADIVCTRGSGKLARLIRFFTRRVGEPRTRINHVGIIVVGGPVDTAIMVEALKKVIRRPLMEGYGGPNASDVAIFRPLNLDITDRWKIATKAMDYVGRTYGYFKLLTNLGDWSATMARTALTLGLYRKDVYLFRRISGDDNYPMCSWVDAHAYAAANKFFGVAPGAATPDDIWDFCTSNPDKYECIMPLGNLKRFMEGK